MSLPAGAQKKCEGGVELPIVFVETPSLDNFLKRVSMEMDRSHLPPITAESLRQVLHLESRAGL